jgi:hypothetical protein
MLNKSAIDITSSDNSLPLYREYCRKCGCELKIDNFGFLYVTDGKRKEYFLDYPQIITISSKFKKIHDLENSKEKYIRKRMKIASKLYFINNYKGDH